MVVLLPTPGFKRELSVKSKKRNSKLLTYTLVVSLLVHLLILLVPLHLERKEKENIIQIVRINPEDLPKQVVDEIGKPIAEETPEESRFLSKYNQKVEKQIKAKNTGPTQNEQQLSLQIREKQESSPKPPVTLDKEKMLLAIKKPNASLQTQEKKQEEKLKMSFTERSLASVRSSTTDDYLPDVEDSNQTLLNTKQFVFYSFYARIKERLRGHWENNLQTTLKQRYNYNSSNMPQIDRDLVTKLKIQLEKNGELKNVFIVTSSGFYDIDNAAVKAFEQAAPFLNPPSGMIEKDGSVKLRWDFIIEANAGPYIKIFLSRN